MSNPLSYGLLQDRPGAIVVQANYSALSVGPHGGTFRWTYTVPSGRRMAVQAAGGSRVVAAAPTAAAGAQVAVTGSALVVLYLHQIGVTVGQEVHDHLGFGDGPVLLAGQTLQGLTLDGSTGGSAHYAVQFAGVEWIDSR